jgi:alpha-acetolactate decarboxylase
VGVVTWPPLPRLFGPVFFWAVRHTLEENNERRHTLEEKNEEEMLAGPLFFHAFFIKKVFTSMKTVGIQTYQIKMNYIIEGGNDQPAAE